MDILLYLHKKGCQLNEEIYRHAVIHGRMEIIRYLEKEGCPRPENIVRIAKRECHHDIADYLLTLS